LLYIVIVIIVIFYIVAQMSGPFLHVLSLSPHVNTHMRTSVCNAVYNGD